MSYLYNIKKPKDLKIIYKKDDISLNKKFPMPPSVVIGLLDT